MYWVGPYKIMVHKILTPIKTLIIRKRNISVMWIWKGIQFWEGRPKVTSYGKVQRTTNLASLLMYWVGPYKIMVHKILTPIKTLIIRKRNISVMWIWKGIQFWEGRPKVTSYGKVQRTTNLASLLMYWVGPYKIMVHKILTPIKTLIIRKRNISVMWIWKGIQFWEGRPKVTSYGKVQRTTNLASLLMYWVGPYKIMVHKILTPIKTLIIRKRNISLTYIPTLSPFWLPRPKVTYHRTL